MTKRLPSARRSPLLPILLLIAAPAAAAPADPDIPALQALAARFSRESAAARTPSLERLSTSRTLLAARLHADPALLLRRLDRQGFPRYLALDNVNSAATIGTGAVQPGGSSGLSLDGSSSPVGQLGLWDGGAVRVTHAEFGGRAVQRDAATVTSAHSTHVAGTMIAAGVDPASRGMAPAAPLDCYDWTDDLAEMAAAAAAGMRVSNHSYSPVAGWRSAYGQWYWHGDPSISATEDWGFGFYDAEAQALDDLSWSAPGYLIVASAGNNRADYGPGSGGEHGIWNGTEWVPSTVTRDPDGGLTGYDSLPWSKTAKNPLILGAVDDLPAGWAGTGSVNMAWFSGFGPTDDGRIKPDLVANGVSLWSSSDRDDGAHATSSGTSMSSPSAAGSIDLLVDHWRATHGADPRAATLKAILFQTADDAGAAPGPDYRFGWGLMNTAAAAALMDADVAAAPARQALEADLLQAETRAWTFDLAETTAVRLTLHWTDPAATPVAPALDPADPMLVNDLDLRLSDGTATHEPWILDPQAPAAPATRGDNVRDNTEQVVADGLPPGRYTVSVTHKGTLATATQPFSLVSSQPLAAAVPPLAATSAADAAAELRAAPNPFTRGTTLSFGLPADATVDVALYDVRGRQVRVLERASAMAAGLHHLTWDGRDDNGRPVASGVYFARIDSGTRHHVEKIVRVVPR